MKKLQYISGFILVFYLLGIVFGSSLGSARKHDERPTKHNIGLNLKNISGDQALSPGLIIVHDNELDFDYLGKKLPESFETLAEVGNPDAFEQTIKAIAGVKQVYKTTAPILPGKMLSKSFYVADDEEISMFFMAVGSNDGYVFVNEITNEAKQFYFGSNYDAGFEENSALLSGFDGGQPDPSQGSKNLENGVATIPQNKVFVHLQLDDDLLFVDSFYVNLSERLIQRIDVLTGRILIRLKRQDPSEARLKIIKVLDQIERFKKKDITPREHDILDYIEYKFDQMLESF